MGYFFEIDKYYISLCKLGNILILFNSEETKKAGRAFKSKHDHLFNNYDKFYCFFDALEQGALSSIRS